MHFSKKTFVDKNRQKKVQQIVYGILFLTLVPSVYITYNMIKTNIFETNAFRFITNEINYPNTFIVSKHIQPDSISVTLIGKDLSEDYIILLHQKMEQYNLKDCKLNIIQGLGKNQEEGKRDELNNLVLQDFYKKNQEQSKILKKEIIQLRTAINNYAIYDSLGSKIAPEIKILFPSVRNIALTKIIRTDVNNNNTDTLTVAILDYHNIPPEEETQRFHNWLCTRMNTTQLEIIQHQ